MSLAAIAVVVALVSLPSLRGFALRQNESDAIRFVQALQAAATADAVEGEESTLARLLDSSASLRHLFNDLELVSIPGVGDRLRCHGYLFDLVSLPAGSAARAWPWSHGRTGRAAFVVAPDGTLFGHANETSRWSGPHAPPELACAEEAGWHRMR